MAEHADHLITVGGHPAVAELAECNSTRDLQRFLRKVSVEFGFEGSCLVRAPTVSDSRLSEIILLSNLPDEFLEEHDREGVYAVCPLIPAIRVAETAFDHEDRNYVLPWAGSRADVISALYRRYEYAYYYVIPLHGAAGNNGALAFLGNRPNLTDIEQAKLGYLASLLKARQALISPMPRPGLRLTERESQCLALTAEGKTTGEIAIILDLSPHTVNHYINGVCVKLDCTNRTQAVAKAIRAGLIN